MSWGRGRSRRRLSAVPWAFLILPAVVGCGTDDVRNAGDMLSEAAERPQAEPGNAVIQDSTPGILVQDQAGIRLELPHPPSRIVSLVPSATGILISLGAQDRLVGRTDFDDDERLEHLPSVGGGLHPSLERLVALDPELVIRFEGEQDRATPQALDRAGIPHLGVRPDRIDDIGEMIRILGRVVRRGDRARELWTRIEDDLDRIAERVADAPRPRVAFLLGGNPPWVAGPGTFLHEILEIAGAHNVMADSDASLYAPVSVEELVALDVDLVLVVEGAQVPSALRRLPVERVPGHVQSPGVDLANSARHLSRLVHPGRWR